MNVNAFVAFLSGVLSFFSPCILPLVPSYLIFISGINARDFRQEELRKHRKTVVLHSIAFIIGFSVVFISLGITSSLIGRFLFAYQEYLMRAGGLILIFFGLYSLNLVRIPFLDQEKAFHLEKKPLGFLGSFVVGMTFSLGWTPCVGPALTSILIIAGTSTRIHEGALLLTIYAAGLAIPFFIAALVFDRLFQLLNRFSSLARYATKILGVLLVIVGLLLFINAFPLISAYTNKLISLLTI